jgi:hypothetical protein
MTLVHSALAGGEWIGDADRLRTGATGKVLGHRVAAPSTLGTFLRSFTWGSARQLDHFAGEALHRAWRAGRRPGPWPLTIDIDSTHCETYGLQKQGAASFVTETVKRARRAGATGPICVRADSGFYAHKVTTPATRPG